MRSPNHTFRGSGTRSAGARGARTRDTDGGDSGGRDSGASGVGSQGSGGRGSGGRGPKGRGGGMRGGGSRRAGMRGAGRMGSSAEEYQHESPFGNWRIPSEGIHHSLPSETNPREVNVRVSMPRAQPWKSTRAPHFGFATTVDTGPDYVTLNVVDLRDTEPRPTADSRDSSQLSGDSSQVSRNSFQISRDFSQISKRATYHRDVPGKAARNHRRPDGQRTTHPAGQDHTQVPTAMPTHPGSRTSSSTDNLAESMRGLRLREQQARQRPDTIHGYNQTPSHMHPTRGSH